MRKRRDDDLEGKTWRSPDWDDGELSPSKIKIDRSGKDVDDSGDELTSRPGAWRGKADMAKRMTKKGAPTKSELGFQDNLKMRMRMKKKEGGLTGPNGVLPEQGVAEESEQIDEVSMEKLLKYVPNAVADLSDREIRINTGKGTPTDAKKVQDRKKGLSRAAGKIGYKMAPESVAEGEIEDAEKAHQKINTPAAFRKKQGGDWKVSGDDLEKSKARNRTSPESLAAIKKLGSVSDPMTAIPIPGLGESEQAVAEEQEMEESGLQAYLGNKKYGKEGMNALHKAGQEGASKEKMANIRAKYDKLDEEDMEEGEIEDAEKAYQKINTPAAFRKAKGGDWKVTGQDLEKEKARTGTSPEGLSAIKKLAGLEEPVKESKDKTVTIRPENEQELVDWLESEGFDVPESTTDEEGNLVYDFSDMDHSAYVYASDFDIGSEEADDDLTEYGGAETNLKPNHFYLKSGYGNGLLRIDGKTVEFDNFDDAILDFVNSSHYDPDTAGCWFVDQCEFEDVEDEYTLVINSFFKKLKSSFVADAEPR